MARATTREGCGAASECGDPGVIAPRAGEVDADRGDILAPRGEATAYLRPLEGWALFGCPGAEPVLRFARRCYRQPGEQAVLERAEVDCSALAPALRRALAALVLLGTISPADCAAIATEAAESGEAGSERGKPVAEPGSTAGELVQGFARIHPQLPGALDDPMRGVLATPLHESLFPSGGGLLAAFERLLTMGTDGAADPLLAYARFFVGCRQTILHLGLVLARSLPPLSPASGAPAMDFFSWWRTRWTQRTSIVLALGDSLALGFPPDLTASTATAITGAIAKLALEHERLAVRLGCAPHVTRTFIDAFVIEMLDGAANLLLNGREGSRCPRPQQIAVKLERGHRYPIRAQVLKTIRLEGTPLEDCFARFFAAPETRLRLPRSGREITVWRLGTCPFPDYGFVAAAGESGPPPSPPRVKSVPANS